jgi:ribosomal protein L37AE/L43A
MTVAPIARTLEQELTALVRGVSLECLVCGEFVLRIDGVHVCSECRSLLAEGTEVPEIELPSVMQAG